ncbi:hypothetical protein ALC60_12432 [Trachymyrmex zeteki]|uniref:Uncharacterized protein n=1 Tax=Mycetomoellerius zeteki TaxID=64791 RepID=A0A151WL07_9HYME|nr:hypothetical protein ALC60_12432 [Trachymyrmex zeteki]
MRMGQKERARELISMRGVYFPQYVRPNARFSSYPPACNGWLLNIGGQDGLLVF